MNLKTFFQQIKDWYTNLTHPVLTEHRLYKTAKPVGLVWDKVASLLEVLGYPPLPDLPESGFGDDNTRIYLRLVINHEVSVSYIGVEITSRSSQKIRYVLGHLDRLSLLEKA